MDVRKFAHGDAELERSPGQDDEIYVGDVVGRDDGAPVSIGFGRWGPGATLTETMAVDDVMIVLEGRLSIESAAGTWDLAPGELVHMPKGERVTIRTSAEGARTAYVTYPHWSEARE
jgi:ethanolamine utilization protein EutQ (cupin superfamily)